MKKIKIRVATYLLSKYTNIIDAKFRVKGEPGGIISDIESYEESEALLTLKIDKGKRKKILKKLRQIEEEKGIKFIYRPKIRLKPRNSNETS